MDSSKEYTTWQQFLGQIIESPAELKRISTAIRVHPVTLQRWARKEAMPRLTNVNRLLQALSPEHVHTFLHLAAEDWPELTQSAASTVSSQETLPPAEFYARVLSAYANTSATLQTQTLHDLLLQQALGQLDPDRQGMAISIVRCVPPLDGQKVLSLREVGGIGTAPWKRDLEQKMYFLGIESLAGAAVLHGRRVVAQSREEASFLFAVQWTAYEESAAAYPILHENRIAGCLLVASARPHYFTPDRLELIECYANLFALSCRADEFYELTQLDLRIMPQPQVQEPYFHSFHQRVLQQLQQAAKNHSLLTLYEAQERTWHIIEKELLQLALSAEG